jgi:hypothetical protein
VCIRLRGCETEWVWGTCVDSGISLCLKLLGGSWEHKSSEKSTVCVYTSIFVIFDLRRVSRAAFATLNWSRSCRSNLCSSFVFSRRRIQRSSSLRQPSEALSMSYGTGLSNVKQYSLSGSILWWLHGTACVNELCWCSSALAVHFPPRPGPSRFLNTADYYKAKVWGQNNLKILICFRKRSLFVFGKKYPFSF